METKPPLPPFTKETAIQKIRMAEDAWNYASTNWLSYVLHTIQWLKAACPTCYTFPFDDMSLTFQCLSSSNSINYGVTFSDLQ